MKKSGSQELMPTGSTTPAMRDDETQQVDVAAETKILDRSQPTRADKPTHTLYEEDTLQADVTARTQTPEGQLTMPADETTPVMESRLGVPRMIGGHRIIRKLGEGGFGVVYEAEQQHPRRPVALKVIRGGHFVDEHHVKLFEREAQALARLKHPGIAGYLRSGGHRRGAAFLRDGVGSGRAVDGLRAGARP